ncbi:MAG: quinone-dependent dihydroorotate dehydrogenase, partial [Leadbetterella sp.]
MSIYKSLIFPILSRFDPESIHYFAMDSLRFLYKLPGGKSLLKLLFLEEKYHRPVNALGLSFPNPVGLA